MSKPCTKTTSGGRKQSKDKVKSDPANKKKWLAKDMEDEFESQDSAYNLEDEVKSEDEIPLPKSERGRKKSKKEKLKDKETM